MIVTVPHRVLLRHTVCKSHVSVLSSASFRTVKLTGRFGGRNRNDVFHFANTFTRNDATTQKFFVLMVSITYLQ